MPLCLGPCIWSVRNRVSADNLVSCRHGSWQLAADDTLANNLRTATSRRMQLVASRPIAPGARAESFAPLGSRGYRELFLCAGSETGGVALIVTLQVDSSSRSRKTSGRYGKNRSLATSATLPAVTVFRKVTIKPLSAPAWACPEWHEDKG